ncbi:O-antigen ligase family protein [Shinella fusca]|uniref:O-antigen ligase-related domain-containing protein n=1 Tax=Shinella fusca TaxID=544480 RepID=A0A7W7YZF9_9HYPH|nr:O-antigen ligase family protein [Shinella fusca]MBB5045190.1 hypothetical protein [Shinella fusca]
MRNYLDRLRQMFDILFIVSLAAAMFLGGKVAPLLAIAGVCPIPFLLHATSNQRYAISIWRLLVPFGLYFTYSLLAFFFFTGLEEGARRPVNPSLELYLIGIGMLAIGLVRGLQVRKLALLFRRLGPWLLVACFLLLTYLMFAEIREGCRVRGLAPWPFIPALLFSTLALLSLVGWARFSSNERWMRLIILAFSVVVSTTYTGSRGVSLAVFGVFGLLFVLSLLPSLKNRVPHWYHIALAAVSGVAISIVVGFGTNCGPASRFASTFALLETMTSRTSELKVQTSKDLVPNTTQQEQSTNTPQVAANTSTDQEPLATADQSIGHRLAMWKTSMTAIHERLVFGHGSLYLQKLITETYGYEHNHNQYLSWLVTGGLLQLALGLIFLAIPWFVSSGLSLADRLLMTMAVSLLWGFAMISDSFLNLKFYTHYYCLLCGVLYAWVNNMLLEDGGSA